MKQENNSRSQLFSARSTDAQHLPLNLAVGGVLAQMIDPQQGLVQRAEPLLARGRPGLVRERLADHAMLLEGVAGEAGRLVIADQCEELDIGRRGRARAQRRRRRRRRRCASSAG